MKPLRHAACVLLAAASLLASPGYAASYSTDNSDLWWTNPPGSENGWGIQFVQRASTIFATMFVYGPAGSPTWYVATMAPTSPGALAWTGALFATSGSYFGAIPYNPALFAGTQVGTMTWTPATVNTGTLTYAVNGLQVTKNLIRQTLVNENYNGHFGGGIHEVDTGCANPAFDGTTENIGILNIVQNGTAVTMTSLPATGGSCAYSGTLTQYGQMGDVQGIFSCSNGSSGTFEIFEFEVTEYGISGRFNAASTVPAGCQASGWFGGLTVTTF